MARETNEKQREEPNGKDEASGDKEIVPVEFDGDAGEIQRHFGACPSPGTRGKPVR